MKLFPVLRTLACVLAVLLGTSGRGLAANYTIQLTDNTGLNPAQYAIYAMGFSYASQLVLGAGGTFTTQTTGLVSSYKVGAGGLTTITLDSATAFTGGRLYFFVVPAGSPAPSVNYGNQPTNPPDATFPPYSIVEITVPASQPATIDIQTVDGFIFPLTVTLAGQTNVVGQQYGQPVYVPGQAATVNRAAIFTAYANFMTAEGAAGTPYSALVFGAGSVNGQPGGILNPGAYLTTVDSSNAFQNLGSALNTAFNADLNTLFGATTLKIQGVASGAGDTGTAIAPDFYTVTSIGSQAYPGTSVSLPALQFTGVNVPANVFRVFNPVGISILTNDAGGAITGTINGNQLTITAGMAVTGLANNMFVSGAGLSPVNDLSTTQIIGVAGNVLTLNQSLGTPAPNSQYRFSKLPQLVMFQTPGQMVLANSGVFADSTVQFPAGSASATVLGNLENQIVSASNRGVAVSPAALSPANNGGTSALWGTQTNWYPAGATQNLFSLFMHVGQTGGTPIFFQPTNASAWKNARLQTMGSAYGFAYDENGGPVPPASVGQPEVPSKFDQNVPVGATVQINFGPWTSGVAPTPAAPPAPQAKVTGKKTLRTDDKTVKIEGTAVGQELFVKYKKKPGKMVTKRIPIQADGDWVFKFKPREKKTVLKFYAESSDGSRSSVQKVKVIKE